MIRKNEREPNKFETGDAALKLSVHTINITSNPKIFKPVYSNVINRLTSDTALIYHKLRVANDIWAKDEKSAKERIRLHDEALDLCLRVTSTIMIAQGLFHLRFKKVSYWNSLVERTQILIKKWQESDIKGYKEKKILGT